ncbi:hypothetical protein [uncultured Treponema sp.]|uniref:hypothetical protein n=1 Tax=uncultured Treponema sp. TaxID=162155 RepID=UPI0025E75368|nr:hypothetical protein [uncultured Treponema sp.]
MNSNFTIAARSIMFFAASEAIPISRDRAISMELKQPTLPHKDTSLQKKIPRTLLNTKQNFPTRKNWFYLVS